MTLYAQQIENTLYFRYSAEPTIEQLEALGDDLIDWWDLQYRQALSADLSLREVQVTALESSTASSVARTPDIPLVGLDGASGSPGNVALAVSFRTVNRGRSFRGRNFVSGIPNDQIAGNTIQPAVIEAVQGAYVDLLDRHNTIGEGQWVVVSRFTDGAPRTEGVATTITSVSIVDPLVDSQRRRLTGRGL